MTAKPSRATPAGRAYNDLRNLARRTGRPTDELIGTYVHEGFLARLGQSSMRDRFLLKGGMLLSVLDARRVTRDIDALARGFAGGEEELLGYVKELAAAEGNDGIVFEVDRARSRVIREDATYAGTRVTMPVMLASSRSKFAIDISVGDPVVPEPRRIELPLLLGGSIELLAYSLETVLAEKIVTAVSLGELNGRDRDYADVWRLTRNNDVSGERLTRAVKATAAYRGVRLRQLSDVVGGLAGIRQVPYRRWCDRQPSRNLGYPERFREVVTDVIAFADPVLDGSTSDLVWKAAIVQWTRQVEDREPGSRG